MTRSFFEVILIFLFLSVVGCASHHRQQYDFYYRISDWEGAEKALREGLLSDPDDPEIYFLLGQVYGHWGKFTELDMAFNRSLAVSNQFAGDIDRYRDFFSRRQVNRGIELYNQGKYQQAIDLLSLVERIRREETLHYPYLGLSYSSLENYEEATHYLTLSMEMNGDELSMLELVRLNHILGSPREVIEVSERFLSRHPARMEILKTLAMAYEGELAYPEAIRTYREILEIEPFDRSALYNLAFLLSQEEQPFEAIPIIEKLDRLEPDNEELRFKLCSLLYETGQYERSLGCFQEYLEANPGEVEALEYLFVLNRNLGLWEDAREIRPLLDQPAPVDSTWIEEGHENP